MLLSVDCTSEYTPSFATPPIWFVRLRSAAGHTLVVPKVHLGEKLAKALVKMFDVPDESAR